MPLRRPGSRNEVQCIPRRNTVDARSDVDEYEWAVEDRELGRRTGQR